MSRFKVSSYQGQDGRGLTLMLYIWDRTGEVLHWCYIIRDRTGKVITLLKITHLASGASRKSYLFINVFVNVYFLLFPCWIHFAMLTCEWLTASMYNFYQCCVISSGRTQLFFYFPNSQCSWCYAHMSVTHRTGWERKVCPEIDIITHFI